MMLMPLPHILRQEKGNREAVLALAEMANTEYRVDDARALLEDYRKLLKKGKRTIHPDNSGDLDQRIDRTENMLGRVEQIEVVDSLVVDAEDFFRHYKLSPESGSLNPRQFCRRLSKLPNPPWFMSQRAEGR